MPGDGHQRQFTDGRFEASQLINGPQLLKPTIDIDMQLRPNGGGGKLKGLAAIHRGEPGRKRS